MYTFKSFISESAKSDKYENDMAKHIADMGLDASRPAVDPTYSDILIKYKGDRIWLEVKMNHSDQLGNTRASFDGKKWIAAIDKKGPSKGKLSPLKAYITKTLNNNKDTQAWLKDLEKFSGIKGMKVPTLISGLSDPKSVPRDVMIAYLKGKKQYILNKPEVDLGELITQHYLKGKSEPAYYMQAGDDFYRIGSANPMGVPNDVPLLSGTGPFKMRIGMRSKYYEVQPEVKITKMPSSKYSLKPGTSKLNPFENIK